MKFVSRSLACTFLAAVVLIGFGQPAPVHAARAALPEGFTRVEVTSGLTHPTAFAFIGKRILVAEKEGTIKIVRADGSVRAKPFAVLHVSIERERGILGVAVDPKFVKNHFVYVYYTTGPGALGYGKKPVNRVSRFVYVQQTGTDETILLDNIPSDTGAHDGGGLTFGADGKLYVATGDGEAYPATARILDTLRGKILRITRTGRVPRSNPFYHTPGARREIYAVGFRNPFRLTVRSFNQTLLVGDVGNLKWEELNAVQAGADYGWNLFEGPCPQDTTCDPAQTDFNATMPPVHYYHHSQGTEQGNAVIAGAFPNQSNYPAPYADAFFYGDWVKGWIHALTLDENNMVTGQYDFDVLTHPVAFAAGPDGNLYVLDYPAGAIYKYIYTP